MTGGGTSNLSLSVHNSQSSLKETKLHFYKSPLEKKKVEDDKLIEAMQKRVPHLNSGLPPRAPSGLQMPLSASNGQRGAAELAPQI